MLACLSPGATPGDDNEGVGEVHAVGDCFLRASIDDDLDFLDFAL
jgi:hypothetical protein